MKSTMFMGLLATALVMGSCAGNKDVKEKAPMRVTTEVVKSTSHGAGKTYVGIVEEREGTAVSFTTMGVVRRMLVSEGQAVSRGQLIADMDDTTARNMLAVAESGMTQANDALQRYGMLHENGSLPEVKWVEIQTKVQQAESQLAIAKKNLADCQLIAPVSGIIGKKNVNAGETAMPSVAVVTILDISSVKVKISVPEAEIKQINSNTSSLIDVEAAGKQVKGGVIEKGIQADALTHTYAVRINAENPDRKLLPGMVANVTLDYSTDQAAAVPTLPVTSVQKRADGTLFVWVIDADNTAHRQPVSVAQTMGTRIAVTSGITDGQRVVTEGYQKLSEGTKVAY
ncbi:MAG: efflux RND transporter periplasmic adaptor subunit [Bacteroidaceae bacterium]|nr:efflux RND transporter periplasmic adaptor subunit [Bacteroidaceae bacterium]